MAFQALLISREGFFLSHIGQTKRFLNLLQALCADAGDGSDVFPGSKAAFLRTRLEEGVRQVLSDSGHGHKFLAGGLVERPFSRGGT